MNYANGDIYYGNWVFGAKEGQGTMTYKDNNTLKEYTGEWKADKPNGKGKMTYSNGDVYNGYCVSGLPEGQGTMTYVNNDTYKNYSGNFKAGKPDGKGKAMFKNGDVYDGNWISGRISGAGTLVYTNGDTFIGTWTESGRIGKLTITNGGWCDGEWKGETFYNGKCSINHKEVIFDGEIKEGKYYNGNGNIIIDGNHYKGEWNNGSFFGYCELKGDSNTPHFVGNVQQDGSKNGTVKYPTGQTYEGTLTCSFIPNGNGTLSNNNFNIDGYWDNGNLVKLNNGNVTIEPIVLKKFNSNVIISNRQVLQLKLVDNKLIFADRLISNCYNKIPDDIKNITEDFANFTIDKYIAANLKTYRVEDYKLCRDDRQSQGIPFLYSFGDAEYQKNPLNGLFHGKFHLWNGSYYDEYENNSYSVKGQFVNGKKDGQWIYERRNGQGVLTGRLIINFKNDIKSGFSYLETINKNGSRTIIKAYYDNNHWNKKGTSYYCYIHEVSEYPLPFTSYVEVRTETNERKITFDKNGKPHGEVFMKQDDVEVKGKYNHGKLMSIEKRNIKKNVTLTPIDGENELKKMWELKLPAAFPVDGESNFRFDRNPLVGLTLIDLTAEGQDYKGITIKEKEETNY